MRALGGAGGHLAHPSRPPLDIAEGRLTAAMWPSGSGKSTLMHNLAGLDSPTEGDVSIAGTDNTRLDDTQFTKLRRDHIGFMFQFFDLLPLLAAEEDIVLPLDLAGRRVDRDWLSELVHRVGLADRLRHRPAEMSGGQVRRGRLARRRRHRRVRHADGAGAAPPGGELRRARDHGQRRQGLTPTSSSPRRRPRTPPRRRTRASASSASSCSASAASRCSSARS